MQPVHKESVFNREVTLLLVDDDDIDAKGVDRALKRLNIQNPIVRANDGLHGLTLLRELHAAGRPYIILLDLNMPRMGGLEMLAELRKDSALTSSVVFVLTTSKAQVDINAAYELHIAGYVVKENVGEGYIKLIEMLGKYHEMVELPSCH